MGILNIFLLSILMNKKNCKINQQSSYIRSSRSKMMFYKMISLLKYFEKIKRKQLHRSLFFNKVTGWKFSQNAQENTCSRVSFLMKMQVGGKKSTFFFFLFFFAPLVTKPKLSALFMLLLIIGKFSNYWHSPNIISNVGSCGDELSKKFKIKQDKDLCQKSLRQMNSLPQLRAGAGSLLF